MNKQEAIKLIEKLEEYYGFSKGVYLEKRDVINIISQIDEPKKPVVPKFVAEWINGMKQEERHLYSVMISLMNKTDHGWTVWKSANMNFSEIVGQAWIYGYEIEQCKLYTVEIPDPNSYMYYRYLSRNDNGICIDASNYAKWKQKKKNQFTEAEIKQDFEWAWQFAKEVDND